eukprot:1901755-Prymnesium_polylepis.1
MSVITWSVACYRTPTGIAAYVVRRGVRDVLRLRSGLPRNAGCYSCVFGRVAVQRHSAHLDGLPWYGLWCAIRRYSSATRLC